MRGLFAAVLLSASVAAAQVPAKIGYQGLLLKSDGTPETGTVQVRFALFGEETGGQELWSESQTIGLTQGFYATFLGEVTPIPASALDGQERFLELTVEGTVLAPRMRLVSVPYALSASSARDVTGGVVEASSIRVGGNVVIDGTGALAGPAAYTGGAGVSVSGTRISLPTSCQPGEVLRWSGAPNGDWECSPASSSSYSADPSGGLALTGTSGTAFSLLRTCADGQLLKWNATGGRWECASDGSSGGTVTQLLTGPGLAGGPITSAGTLDLRLAASGGLSSALGAGSNELGIAAGGVTNSMLANSGLTVTAGSGLSGGGAVSLGGTVTLSSSGVLSVGATAPLATSGGQNPTLSLGTVGIAHGGTGITTQPTAAGQYLRSAGAGQWGVGSIQPSDLPSLAGAYVDLSSSQTIDGVKTFTAPIAGSITGNAATVTNGVYSTATYADPAWIGSLAGSKVTGDIAGNAAGFTGSLSGDVTGAQGATTVARLQGRAVHNGAPLDGHVLKWDATNSRWAPALDAAGTGTVTQVNNGTGLVGGPITGSGTLAIDPSVVPRLGAANTFTVGGHLIQTGSSGTTGLTIRGASGQTASLQQWQSSASGVVASVSPAGVFSGDGSGLANLSAASIATGTLPVARGGTNSAGVGPAGTVAYSTGSAYGFTLVGTAGQVLKSAGSGAPAWGQVNLATESTGILPATQGGTGLSTAGLPAGSLLMADSAGAWTTLAPGSAGQVLKMAGGGPAWSLESVGSPTQVPRDNTLSAAIGSAANIYNARSAVTIGADGLPVIGYNSPSGLRVTKCGDATCSAGNVVSTIGSLGSSAAMLSIAIGADGFPVLAASAGSTPVLKMAKCADPACSVSSFVTVDGTATSGLYNSIAVGVDGRPAISYAAWNGSTYEVRVAACGNADCSAGNTLTTIDTGYDTSIAIGVDGLPVVSYYFPATGDLKVAKCTSSTCSAFSLSTVDGAGGVSAGFGGSVTIGDDGRPVISYLGGGGVRVAKCADAGCSSATVTIVDSATGANTSISMGPEGLPVISFLRSSGSSYLLKVVKCGSAACDGGHSMSTVYSNAGGESSSIAVPPDGLPVASFLQYGAGSFHLLKCANRMCVPYWARR